MHACMQRELNSSCLNHVVGDDYSSMLHARRPALAAVTTPAPALHLAHLLQWICRSHMPSLYVLMPQERLPRITPPASPAHSEETVGFAPHHSAAEAKSCAEVRRASEDPTDISSHWRATKRRRCCMPICAVTCVISCRALLNVLRYAPLWRRDSVTPACEWLQMPACCCCKQGGWRD